MAITLDGITGITASGNITGNYILGNGSQLSGIITSVSSLSNGSSNVDVAVSNGNVTVGVGGTPNVGVFTTTGANVTGYVTATGNITGGNLSGTNIAGTLTTAAQTNITSVGTLGSLSVTGNANVGNLGATNIVGTLTTAAQTNITSVGTLGSLSVTGNANVGNLGTAGNITASYLFGNGSQLSGIDATSIQNGTSNVKVVSSGGNVTTSVGGTSNVLVVTTTGANVTGTLNATGNANVGNIGATNAVFTNIAGTLTTAAQTNITSVGTLESLTVTANVTGGNLLTGGVVTATGNVSGGNITTAGQVVATGNVTAGNLVTSGSGGDITGANVISSTAMTATGNVTGGNLITAGLLSVTGNANVGNIGATNIVGTLTTASQTNITSVGTLGSLSVTGNISGGNVSGTLLTGTLATAAQPNVTSVGTLTSLSVSGNVTGGNLITAGNVQTDNIVNPTANTSIGMGNGSGVLTLISAGNQTQFAPSGQITLGGASQIIGGTFGGSGITLGTSQTDIFQSRGGNVTVQVGTGGTIANTWTFTNSGNLLAPGNVVATGNVTGGNLTTGGVVTATGNITGGNVSGTLLTGTLTTAAQPNVTSLGTLTGLSVTGNITQTGNLNITGNINATGNLNYQNVNDLVVGDPLIFLGANNVANLVDLGFIVTYNDGLDQHGGFARNHLNGVWGVFGNVVAEPTTVIDWGNAIYQPFQAGSATFAGANINGALTGATTINASGNASVGNISATNISGTLETASQPNITSVGTLGSLSVTGNITGGNLSGTNIAGTLTTAAQTNITSVGTLGSLAVTGNITSGNLSGTNIVGTLETAAQPNITSVGTLTSLSVTGNISGGNLTTGGVLSVTGNANVGNLGTSGNITASYLFGNGSQLSGIDATSIQNGSANVRTFLNGNVTTSAAGTANVLVVTSSGANVTGTLSSTGSLAVDGGAYGNVTTTAFASVFGSGQGPNPYSVMQVRSSDGVSGLGMQAYTDSGTLYGNTAITFALATIRDKDVPSNLVTKAYIDSTGLTVTGIANVSGNVTGGNLNTAGNITGSYLVGNGSQLTGIDATAIQNGTSNVKTALNGNVTVGVGGTDNIAVFSTGGANVTGYITASGNITGSYLFGNGSQLTGIDATAINNGTSNVKVTSSGGNVTISVGGTPNVAVVTTTGANIAGTLNVTGDVTFGGNLIDAGALTISTSSNGNITLSPNGSGVVVVNTDIRNGQGNGVGNIGSSSVFFNTVFAKATSAQYADLAEMYVADLEYSPATVLSFGGAHEVTLGSVNDSRVAGVVSTNPSYIMNSGLEGEHVVAVALTGRVPCRVLGTVRKGDMMVSAGNGYARAQDNPRIGTVIGKALEDFDGDSGVIEVVVGRM
jgi:hypothetical protein